MALLACVLFVAPTAFAQQKREPFGKVQAERYEIDVRFEPERGWLTAKAAVTVRAGEYTEAIEFELNPRLEIKEITDGQGRKLQWDRSRRIGSSKLAVRLAEPCGADQSITLTFAYEGAPLLGGLDYINKDGILLRDESRWYPAVNLAAFTQNRVTMRLPSGWMGVTSGDLSSSRDSKPEAVVVWQTRAAVSSRSLVASPVAAWKCNAPPGSPVHRMAPQPGFVYTCGTPAQWPGDCCDHPLAERVRAILGSGVWPFGSSRPVNPVETLRTATAEDERFPFRDLIVVQGFPGQRGAIGYSAPGFLVVSEDVVKFSADPGYMPEFLPHEIAHQWFPIEVTLAQPEDGWLAESLAEYLAWRHLQEKRPEAARVMVARAMRDALAPDPLPPLHQGLRMFALHDWDVTYAGLYQRGMLVWRTLETVIGRTRVDAALREYYRRFAGRSASVAGFRKICEEISGRDLAWFFAYFLDGTEIPEMEIHRAPASAPNEYAGEIVVKNVPPEFTARVEMKLLTRVGVVEHSVATRGTVTPFTVSVPAAVTRVVLDPDARILRWTEAARLNRAQRVLMAQVGDAEEEGKVADALPICQKALDADPADVGQNAQFIYFQMGRLYYRRNLWTKAAAAFGLALQARALDPGADAFYRAWSHAFRARIARRQGSAAQSRKEAGAGLKLAAHALETRIRWPGAEREESAREALQALLGVQAVPMKK